MMKDFIRLLSMAILAMMCFLTCKNTQKEIEEFLKKEIVAEFTVTIPFSTYFAFAKDFVPLQPQNTSNYV